MKDILCRQCLHSLELEEQHGHWALICKNGHVAKKTLDVAHLIVLKLKEQRRGRAGK